MILLSVSIFLNKGNWNVLFANAIQPFVVQNALLKAYTIEFSYLSGENIRLALLTDEVNAPELSAHAENYFNNFFSNAGLSSTEVCFPVNGVFMPFPANTVRFGLYHPRKISTNELADHLPSTHLSQIMLSALKDDEIDDEVILTFAFYLKLGLVKTVNLVSPQFINDLKITEMPLAKVSEDVVLKFEEARETLVEITDDIFRTEKAIDLPGWFKQWMDLCRLSLHNHSDELAIQTIFKNMTVLIVTQLALSAKMNLMLNYFVERMLLYEP